MAKMTRKHLEAKYRTMVAGIQEKKKSEHRGDINTYICSDCKKNTKYIYVDTGLTASKVPCGHCPGKLANTTQGAHLEHKIKPLAEWYRPDLKETLALWKKGNQEAVDYILLGGLLSRKLTKEGLDLWNEKYEGREASLMESTQRMLRNVLDNLLTTGGLELEYTLTVHEANEGENIVISNRKEYEDIESITQAGIDLVNWVFQITDWAGVGDPPQQAIDVLKNIRDARNV